MSERQCETCGGERRGTLCAPCGRNPSTCICLTPAQVAAYVTGGDNARWLKRPEKSEAA